MPDREFAEGEELWFVTPKMVVTLGALLAGKRAANSDDEKADIKDVYGGELKIVQANSHTQAIAKARRGEIIQKEDDEND